MASPACCLPHLCSYSQAYVVLAYLAVTTGRPRYIIFLCILAVVGLLVLCAFRVSDNLWQW